MKERGGGINSEKGSPPIILPNDTTTRSDRKIRINHARPEHVERRSPNKSRSVPS
jgi:hypothetical protein